jgi:hypothetical protein
MTVTDYYEQADSATRRAVDIAFSAARKKLWEIGIPLANGTAPKSCWAMMHYIERSGEACDETA